MATTTAAFPVAFNGNVQRFLKADMEFKAQLARLRAIEEGPLCWSGTEQRFDVAWEGVAREVQKQLDRTGILLGKGHFGNVKQVVCSDIPMAEKCIRTTTDHELEMVKREIKVAEALSKEWHSHITKLVGTYYVTNRGSQTDYCILTFPVANCNFNDFLNHCETLWPPPRPHNRLGISEDNLKELQAKSLDSLTTAAAIHIPQHELDGSTAMHPAVKAFLKRLMGCLIQTMEWIHLQNVQHQDLKPANLLLRNGYLYITDFGLSRDKINKSTYSYPGCTRGWNAPEIEEKHNPQEIDIYSLGCIMLYMTTLMYSITSSQECQDMLNRHLHDPERREKEIRDHLTEPQRQDSAMPGDVWPSSDLVKLIQKMLTHERKSRPTLTEVNRALRNMGGDNHDYHGLCCPPNPKKATNAP